MILSGSEYARQAFDLVKSLQTRFVLSLENWAGRPFTEVQWLRDDGRHGGGTRFGAGDDSRFNRATVNVSQVQYEDDPGRPQASASALSAIVHPASPWLPSVHIHISWAERKNARGYWRMMADLNPALPREKDKVRFLHALHDAAPGRFKEGVEQGDQYFYIPALGRHRGVAHFYLEGYNSGDFGADSGLAVSVGGAAIETYMGILGDASVDVLVSEKETAAQRAYHTLYFFQVMTLDRGTTAGLLVHDQNDAGILGSLPARVDRQLLASWKARMPAPQDELLTRLLAVLPPEDICSIDDAVKLRLAGAVRAYYADFPDALDLQAGGPGRSPTIENHR